MAQPLARPPDESGGRTAGTGLLVLVAGLVLGAVTAQTGATWLLVPSSIVLGSAYGLCLVAGLAGVQRLSGHRALAGLTAIYYSLTYLGFAAPYLLALAAHFASYTLLLAITGALALATAARVTKHAAGPSPTPLGTSCPLPARVRSDHAALVGRIRRTPR
jgi:hypothetical protein